MFGLAWVGWEVVLFCGPRKYRGGGEEKGKAKEEEKEKEKRVFYVSRDNGDWTSLSSYINDPAISCPTLARPRRSTIPTSHYTMSARRRRQACGRLAA
jgi:hypothetical protein